MNKPNFSAIVKTVQGTVAKHSPEILTGIGIAGTLTAVFLAVKATPKALKQIEQKKQELETDALPKIDVVKACWKCYVPAAVTWATSSVCLIGASSVHLKRNAALATAYKLSETALTEYREQVVETIGEKREQTVREKVAQQQLDKHPISRTEVFVTGDGETTFLGPLSNRYFKSDRAKVEKVENALNKQLIHDICGEVSLNEFYEELGLSQTDIGDKLGWTTEHMIDLDIHAGLTDKGDPCLVLGHHNAPLYLP